MADETLPHQLLGHKKFLSYIFKLKKNQGDPTFCTFIIKKQASSTVCIFVVKYLTHKIILNTAKYNVKKFCKSFDLQI